MRFGKVNIGLTAALIPCPLLPNPGEGDREWTLIERESAAHSPHFEDLAPLCQFGTGVRGEGRLAVRHHPCFGVGRVNQRHRIRRTVLQRR